MQNATEHIENFKLFLEQYYEKKLYENASNGAFNVYIDFFEIAEFSSELADLLLESPEDGIRAIEMAIDQFDIKRSFKARIFNLPNSQFVKIRNIRSSNLGRFFYTEGIVRQSSDVRPKVVSAKFECPSCGNTMSILQLDTKFKEPIRCSCGRRGHFKLLSKDLVDAQRLVVEESPDDLDGGEQPKRIPIFLQEDLVEPKMEKRTTPGSKIKIVGIIKEVPITLKTGAQSTTYDLAMEANSIIPIVETFEEIKIDPEEEEKIKELTKDPRLFERLINSIAPSVHGYEKIKEALILQMASGIRKVKADGTIIRGDIDVLLVGDAGAAKSTLLQFISKSAPKSRFVSGKGASSAGLTASVVKDEFIKGWALEGGALVLANGGIVCIDELDKMTPEDRSAMHEALEQQQVSISKANIQATLSAKTTVLAAANPKMGRFDPYTSIASQIDLPSPLINRFDLIFPMRDIPNKERDERIASHVLKSQKDSNLAKPELSSGFLKKYMAYIKQNVKPELTDAAINEIKKFYVDLRNKGSKGEEDIKPIPISARQLEALVRLAEASAKLRLSKKVMKQDAQRAIDLLTYCLMQIGIDPETGKIDIDRISTGISASQRGRIITIREMIKDLEGKFGKSIPIEAVFEEAGKKNISEDQVDEAIERLKREAELFEPKKGFISKL